MAKRLVIVESPTKAKTIEKYLGGDFVVEASVGHIRDLPSKASQVPEEFKKSQVVTGITDEFQAIYVLDDDKKSTVSDIRKQMKDADELFLATDADREGEAPATGEVGIRERNGGAGGEARVVVRAPER